MTRASSQCGQCQQPLVAPATHLQLHPHQRDAEPRFAWIVWQRLAEFVERAQPRLDRLLDAVLRHLPLQSEVGESGAVGRLGQILVGLVKQGMQGRDVTDQ